VRTASHLRSVDRSEPGSLTQRNQCGTHLNIAPSPRKCALFGEFISDVLQRTSTPKPQLRFSSAELRNTWDGPTYQHSGGWAYRIPFSAKHYKRRVFPLIKRRAVAGNPPLATSPKPIALRSFRLVQFRPTDRGSVDRPDEGVIPSRHGITPTSAVEGVPALCCCLVGLGFRAVAAIL